MSTKSLEETLVPTKKNVFKKIFTNITVEPLLFLSQVAVMMQVTYTPSMLIRKYCLTDLAQPLDVCTNLTNYPDIKKEAEEKATTFFMYKTIFELLPTVILSFFIGSWSDKNGRKLLMIIPNLTMGLSMIFYSIIAYYMTEIPVEYMLLGALPFAFGGNLLAVMSSCLSYIADITTEENRTLRFAIAQAFFVIGAPVSSYLGGVVINYGHVWVYVFSAVLYFVAFLYSLTLKETIQKPSDSKCCSLSTCSVGHAKDLVKTVYKKRDGNDRLHVCLLVLEDGLIFMPKMSELLVFYLYTSWKYNMSDETYSYLFTAMLLFSTLGLMTILPIFSTLLKFKDTTLGIVSCIANIGRAVGFALSNERWMLFAITPIYLLTEMSNTFPKTIISKIVSSEEQGKIMAVVCATEAAVSAIGSAVYSNLLNATRQSFPEGILVFSAVMWLCAIPIFGLVHFQRRNIGQSHELKPRSQSLVSNNEVYPETNNMEIMGGDSRDPA